ncbi:solute carrier family 23 member 2-like [Limulus polyphemus]|uniref:Solute carrier family 23 member 2-like n=1 Tax=Limulus polyphemus TaxID=6850 RepID=A0ABM1TGY1_LIMPO|nr:solute carrier family 23 member 2-like [Limulus polyphemus]
MENSGLELETNEEEKTHEDCDLKISVPQTTKQICQESTNKNVLYGVEDVPPWYLCILLGIQHYLTMFGATVTYPFLITPKLCIREDDPARGYITATNFFVSGLATLFQTALGVRLPIIQGCTFTLLVPTFAILDLPQWRCPNQTEIIAARGTNLSSYVVTEEEWEELWQSRMREVQGAIIIASLFEVFIGFTGIIGYLLYWITPLAIVPTVALIGLPLFREATGSASQNWGIAILTMLLMAFFSQYLRNVDLPGCSYKKVDGWRLRKFPFFKLFPVLLTILVVWLLCFILTTTESIAPDNPARTDIRINVLHNSPWFRFPYPGQWGLPTVSVGAVFGILAGIIGSTIESVGDYYACAKLAGAPPPPVSAVNRGIFTEGVSCVLSGSWGTGGALTSYSENIGAIGVTRVGSRRVVQYGALIMMIFGMLGKFGALFVTIPDPIIGGIFCVMFSIVTAVGLSNLQFVDLSSSRNLFVLGISLFMGIAVPEWIKTNPDAVNVGNDVASNILAVLLSTSMFVGGFLGLLLDNTIPGTEEERGLIKWRQQIQVSHLTASKNEEEESGLSCYDFPVGMGILRRLKCFSYFPISPTYNKIRIKKTKGQENSQ